jgi:N utilization substance protein A
MKGSRVQSIIRELRGERIDIIEWSEDPAVFAANALSPAKVSKVEINSFEEKRLTITVADDQLSLAIGKNGQNVRLAAKLVGWHIDIRSAEEAARDAAAQLEAVMSGGEASLTDIRESLALDQITTERLKERGIETIEELSKMTVDELVEIIDVSFDQATEVIERAKRLLAQKMAREAAHPHETAIEEDATEAAAEESDNLSGRVEATEETDSETLESAPTETSESEETSEATDEVAEASAAEPAVETSDETPQAESLAAEESEAEHEEVGTAGEAMPTDEPEETKNAGK